MIKLGGKYDGQMWVGDPTTSRSPETEVVSQPAQSRPGIWAAGNYIGLFCHAFGNVFWHVLI